MAKRGVVNPITLAILIASVLALSACQEAETATAPAPKPVRAMTVAPEPRGEVIRYAAVIKPRVEADLGFRIAGKVTERLVEVGSKVEAGAPLARLDPSDIELQVRAARAQLESAKADAENARTDFARYAKLKQGEWTTTQEFDRRETLLDKADAHVREVEASLNVLVNSLRYATLEADGAGVVTAVLIEPGQVVAQGQTVISVARDGELEAVANIPEHKVSSLDDQTLSVELWSLPGVELKGRLREIAPAADSGTRTFQARVTLIDPPQKVRQGMTATLLAAEPEGAPVVRLPLPALTQSGDRPAVWVIAPAEDRLALRPVTVARYVGDSVLLTAGVDAGERVVTAGVHMLESGQKVRVWAEPTP